MNNALKKSDKVHILVVDDDDRLRLLLERYLKENNLLVSVAKDAYEAEKLLGLFVFDLLIVDVMMPGLSGVEFTQNLRKKNNVRAAFQSGNAIFHLTHCRKHKHGDIVFLAQVLRELHTA